MRWKVFFGLSLAFLSGLFLTQSSFAASQSFSYDSNSDPKPQQVYWTADNSYNGLTFTPTFVLVEGTATRNDVAINVAQVSPAAFNPYSAINIVPDSNYHFSVLLVMPWGFNGRWSNLSSITYTFFDYNPASSEPCPECPPVPDLPYGEKFDKLTNAVIIVAATMLVLYFFFAIYNMFFKGLK